MPIKNTASKTPDPHDTNAKELAELKGMEKAENEVATDDDLPFTETPEEKEQRELKFAAALEKEMEVLKLIADEVKVAKLKQHLGKKLAYPVRHCTPEDFIDESNGEVVTIEMNDLFLNTGTILTEDIIEDIQNKGVKTVFIYKPGCEPVAPSVITQAPEPKEKDRYDSSRPEIKSIQKAIQCVDKIEAIVNKLNVPEDVKKDIAYNVHWAVVNCQEAREWIHLNKKQNKSR